MVDPKDDCSRQAQVYIVTCNSCNMKVEEGPENRLGPRPTEAGGEARLNYIGMTGTSLHARGMSHLTAVKAKLQNNALALHCIMQHAGEIQQFTMKCCSSHRTVLSRYKTEAVFIEHQRMGTSLNSRMEGGGGRGGIVCLDVRVNRM